MFTRWLVKDRRTDDYRLAHLSKVNADTDRRRVRRALTTEEFAWLLRAAEAGPPIQHISGSDRAILYIIAAYTCFRRNEIGSITANSFAFDSNPPTLTAEAGYSKRRRKDVQPLRVDFADRIKTFIACKPGMSPHEPLLDIRGKRTSEMIARDLGAARAIWINEVEGGAAERKRREETFFLAEDDVHGRVVDFHALRTTFITNLTRSGAAPTTAQILARHCSIDVTMNTYTTLGVLDTAAAVEALPAIPTVENDRELQRIRATGTDDRVAMQKGATMTGRSQRGVPTMVPSGAELGTVHLASHARQSTPNCTEHDRDERENDDDENAKSPKESSASRASTRRNASIRNNGRGGARTLTGVTPHGILSPEASAVSPEENGKKHSSAAPGAALVPGNDPAGDDLAMLIETMPIAELATILQRRTAADQRALSASLQPTGATSTHRAAIRPCARNGRHTRSQRRYDAASRMHH